MPDYANCSLILFYIVNPLICYYALSKLVIGENFVIGFFCH